MAASDAAFVDAQNQSRRGRLNEEAAVKQEERQGTLDERQDTLFNRSTTLFEQQQKLFGDEQAQKKLAKKMNTAAAMWRGSGGQVFQPFLDAYKDVPDGGKMHSFSRNDDGSFNVDMEWEGERFTSDSMSFEEASKMMMSIANPLRYLEESGATALAEAEHQNKLELARIKALGKQKEDTKIIDGKMSAGDYTKFTDAFGEDYKFLFENQPDLLKIPDAAAEDGFRQITPAEYRAGRFMKLGFDFSGAVMQDGNVVDKTPPNVMTATFAETQKYFLDSDLGDQITSVDMAIDEFIKGDINRGQELLDRGMFSGSTKIDKERRRRIERAIQQKKSTAKSKADAAAADSKAAIEVINSADGDAVSDNDPRNFSNNAPGGNRQGVIPDKAAKIPINPATGKPYPVNEFIRKIREGAGESKAPPAGEDQFLLMGKRPA